MNKTTIAMIFALAASQALAQTAPTRDPEKVEGGAFAVESFHTRVLFSVSHFGFTTYYGEFSGVSGALDLDPKAPAASRLDIRIPVASVDTTNAKLDSELKSDKWLDSAKYPDIAFKATKVTLSAPGRADVVGNLTLHGKTKPVILHARLHGAGFNPLNKHYTVGFDATAKIKRSDFGVNTYVPLVGDDVDIVISAAFERQG